MKTQDFYNWVSRLADTEGLEINVAATRRVLSLAFLQLAHMDATEHCDTVVRAMSAALAAERRKARC